MPKLELPKIDLPNPFGDEPSGQASEKREGDAPSNPLDGIKNPFDGFKNPFE